MNNLVNKPGGINNSNKKQNGYKVGGVGMSDTHSPTQIQQMIQNREIRNNSVIA